VYIPTHLLAPGRKGWRENTSSVAVVMVVLAAAAAAARSGG